VTPVVHIKDDGIAIVEVLLDGGLIRELALEGVPVGLDGSPHQEVAIDISAVATQPLIQVLWGDILLVDLFPTVVENHGHRGHQAARAADRVGLARAQLIFTPFGVALFEQWVSGGARNSHHDCQSF
jgi:hypothetical protein